jgi:hypothetical protein
MSNLNLIRITSFGKSKSQDKAHLNYINRFGTAIDEMGNSITGNEKNILNRHDERQSWSKKISTRISISLPSDRVQADRAYEVLREMLAEKYDRFVIAYHEDTKNGNNHSHVYLQNLDRLSFSKLRDKDIFNAEFQTRLEREGITYSYKRHKELQPKMSQAEIHMREKGQELWKDDMRDAVSYALSSSEFDFFVCALAERGIFLVRETPNSLTFQDLQGNKARLDKLFPRMKNRADIINHIKNQSKEGNMKKEDLLRAERSFVNRLNSYMEDMLSHGVTETQVQSRIEKILQHRTNSEDVQERWHALKLQQEELKEERQNWQEERQKIRQQQYEQQRQEREQEYQQRQQTQALQRALASNNPISAFAAALVLIIAEIKKRQQTHQQQKQRMDEKEIMRDIMNTKETLKNPEPEPFRGPER